MSTKIKVVGNDRMFFWVDANTLEPLGLSSFDPWAFSDPELVTTMSESEWQSRRYVTRSVISRNVTHDAHGQ